MDITVSGDIEQEFLALVRDILEDTEFQKLSLYRQHRKTTRLMHSINVSYISWLIARKLGWDATAAARAGLLHDFFLYAYGEDTPSGKLMAFDHPRTAAKNSAERFDIPRRSVRQSCPTCSLWGLCPPAERPGCSRFTDKVCASVEFFHVDMRWQEKDGLPFCPLNIFTKKYHLLHLYSVGGRTTEKDCLY